MTPCPEHFWREVEQGLTVSAARIRAERPMGRMEWLLSQPPDWWPPKHERDAEYCVYLARHRWLNGSLDLDEFERLLDDAFGIKPKEQT